MASNLLPPVPTNAEPGGYAWSDWYQKLRLMLNSSVRSFNTRTGAVTLTSGDVTTALTYTPYNATNPAGYITAAGAPVQSFNTRTGAISLTSADVTNALTYTPYNATNPSGYISSVPWATPGTIGSTTPNTGAFTTLKVSEGSNANQGIAVLVAGTKTVSNTSITANSRIFLTSNLDGGTPGWLRVSSRVVGTSFTITSSNVADTSTVAYEIFEPA